MSRNLSKVQDMLDGNFKTKIQSGYVGEKEPDRKIGDKWTDVDGIEWEQKQGYRVKVNRMPNVGLFDKQCKDCNTPCTTSYDKETWLRMNRCYGCQTEFELNLKFMKIGQKNNKHFFWVKLQELKRWDAIDAEIEQYMEDLWVRNGKKAFDTTVANAIANHELENSFKINKNLTK